MLVLVAGAGIPRELAETPTANELFIAESANTTGQFNLIWMYGTLFKPIMMMGQSGNPMMKENSPRIIIRSDMDVYESGETYRPMKPNPVVRDSAGFFYRYKQEDQSYLIIF
jgi:hypothetical protein